MRIIEIKKQSMDRQDDLGYIYLLQTRESWERKEPIYKMGRTHQLGYNRFANYPNGARLLLHMSCMKSCVDLEKQLLSRFRDLFDQCDRCNLYGSEYFRGDYVQMIDEIYMAIRKFETPDLDVVLEIPPLPPSPSPLQSLTQPNSITAKQNNKLDSLSRDDNNVYKCTKCCYNTTRKSNMRNHLKRKIPCAPPVNDEQEDIICQPCEPNSSSSVTPDTDSNKNPFQCSKCEKEFSRKSYLEQHESKCDGLHPLQCKICLKMFASKFGKYQHKKNVDCGKHMVSSCEQTTSSYSVTIDDCSKSFRCSKCKKLLKCKQNLQNHENTCDGLNPLQCNICLKMFATKQSKCEHKKNVKCVKTLSIDNNAI